MFGWSISARACRSASKRAIDLPRVHARLDDLQGDLAADRLRLLGHVDHAHAALADLLQQLVRADDRAGALGDRRRRRRRSTVGDRGRGLEEARRPASWRRAAARPARRRPASPPQASSR